MNNTKFIISQTKLSGPKIISPILYFDNRGKFLKEFGFDLLKEIKFEIKESFYTYSQKNVIRALHFQEVKPQAKLIRCIKGKIFDVVVDLRQNSKDIGKWESFILSEENNLILYIPEGFAHGYLVLEDSIVSYKCNEYFSSQFDSGIIFNDQDIAIEWPTVNGQIILSDKDKSLKSFSDFLKTNTFKI